jgi:cytochrome c oxidase subunit 4
MDQYITPKRTYIFIYVALLILLAATIGAAFLDLGILNPVVAVSIAVIKAVLVILFFMNVRRSDNVVRFYVIAGFFWLAILIGLTLSDYLTRVWIPTIDR